MTQKITFEQLPDAIQHISKRLDEIEKLLEQNSNSPKAELVKPLTIRQAAKFLDLAIPTIYSKVSRGEIPVYKPPRSRRIYFLEKDLIEYLQQGRKETVSEIQDNPSKYLNERGGHHG